MARSRQAITFEVHVLRRGKWQIHARYPEGKKALAVQDGKSLGNLSTIRAVKVVRRDYGRRDETTVYESPSLKDLQAADGKSGAARQGKAGARTPISAAAPENPAAQPAAQAGAHSNVRVFSKLLLVVIFSIGIAALLTFLASVWLSDSDISADTQGKMLFGALVGTFLISAISLAKSFLSADELNAWMNSQGDSPTPPEVLPAAPKGPPVASPSPKTDEGGNEAARLADAAAAMLAETLHGEAPEAAERPDAAAERPDAAAEGAETTSPYTEEQKVFMKKFLSAALEQAQARRDKMDSYDKFGIDLFLAGACEALSLERDLDGRAASEILSDSVQFMGFEKAQAETFSGRYRDYLLADPRYMQMFVAGRDALKSYFSGDNGGTKHLEQALEEWNRPKAREEKTEMTTVMFTDMVGSTSLTLTVGDAVAQQAVRAHNLIVREALREFGGREIKHTGDGIMAAFPTTSNSVEAAIAIQVNVRARNRVIPEPPLHLKIGINAGEPIVEDDDLFGATVQLAARVVDAAQTEQILVSDIVRGICAGKNLRFVNRGPYQLDGFKDNIVLHEAVWDENVAVEEAPATGPPPPEDTPAEEGTGDPDAGETAEQPVAAEPARAHGR